MQYVLWVFMLVAGGRDLQPIRIDIYDDRGVCLMDGQESLKNWWDQGARTFSCLKASEEDIKYFTVDTTGDA